MAVTVSRNPQKGIEYIRVGDESRELISGNLSRVNKFLPFTEQGQTNRVRVFRDSDGSTLDASVEYLPSPSVPVYSESPGKNDYGIVLDVFASEEGQETQLLWSTGIGLLDDKSISVAFYVDRPGLEAKIGLDSDYVVLPEHQWTILQSTYIVGAPNSGNVFFRLVGGSTKAVVCATDFMSASAGGYFSYLTPDQAPNSGVTSGNIFNPSVTESRGSANPLDLSGGAASIEYQLAPGSVGDIRDDEIIYRDDERNSFRGHIYEQSDSPNSISISAAGVLEKLNRYGTIPPYSGGVRGYMYQWPVDQYVTSSIRFQFNPQISVTGFEGNLLDHFKDLMAYLSVFCYYDESDVYLSNDNSLFSFPNIEDYNRSFEKGQLASKVTVDWFESSEEVDFEVYPLPDSDPSPQTVGAGEYVEFEVSIPHGLRWVNQPPVVDWVNNEPYDGTRGAYAVVGSDGLPITAAEWTARGGVVETELRGTGTLAVKIYGANIPGKAPFRVGAMSSGNTYSALRITGTGIKRVPHEINVYTGAEGVDDDGPRVTNPFITSRERAFEMGAIAAKSLSDVDSNINLATRDYEQWISRLDHQGCVYEVSTISSTPGTVEYSGKSATSWAEFESKNDGVEWGQVNTTWKKMVPRAHERIVN